MPKSAAILKCLLKSSQNSEDTGLPQRATGPWPGTTHPWASRGLWHPRIVGKIFCSCVFLGRLIIVFIKHSEVSASQRIHLQVDCYKVELEVLQFLPQTVNKTCGSPRRFGIVQPARVPAEVLIDWRTEGWPGGSPQPWFVRMTEVRSPRPWPPGPGLSLSGTPVSPLPVTTWKSVCFLSLKIIFLWYRNLILRDNSVFKRT